MTMMKHQDIIFTNSVAERLSSIIESMNCSGTFILVDENTDNHVLSKIVGKFPAIDNAAVIKVKPGDVNKNLDSLVHIWNATVTHIMAMMKR